MEDVRACMQCKWVLSDVAAFCPQCGTANPPAAAATHPLWGLARSPWLWAAVVFVGAFGVTGFALYPSPSSESSAVAAPPMAQSSTLKPFYAAEPTAQASPAAQSPPMTPIAAPSTQPVAEASAPAAPRAASPAPAPLDRLSAPMTHALQEAIDSGDFSFSKICGGAFAQTPFAEMPRVGILIGCRVGRSEFCGQPTFCSLQPIYLTPKGKQLGGFYGSAGNDGEIELVAKPGYAVGAVILRGGGGMDSIYLTFMRIGAASLDERDEYVSGRVGGDGGGEMIFNGHGAPIIGLSGRNETAHGFIGVGVIFLHQPDWAEQ